MSLVTPRDAGWREPAQAAPANPDPPRTCVQGVRAGPVLAAVASSTGLAHAVNEDCHTPLSPGSALFVVADGVGGGAMAAHVSHDVVAHLHAALDGTAPDAPAVTAAMLDADRTIARDLASCAHGSGAATVALCTPSNAAASHWLVAWVGDCRVYRLDRPRDAFAQAVSVDDTYRHLGEMPPAGSGPDDPARMVGNGAVDRPNVRSVSLGRGGMLVLCSDGVHRHVAPDDIARVLRSAAPLPVRCARLVALARTRGSQDDATVLVVQRARPVLLRTGAAALALGLALGLGASWWMAGADATAGHALLQRGMAT